MTNFGATRMKNTLKLEAQGDREIVMTRAFDAPCHMVFEAFTRPDLLRRWLHGAPGWTMPICEVDLRVGGRYRYLWRNENGTEMSASGVYREIFAPERIVATETFDPPWYPGQCVISFALREAGGKTTLTQTLQYESQAAREVVLKSPMEGGVAMSFNQLEELLTLPDFAGAHK
ncbi:MAG TPA: SRPBCC family protein [Terriglobales bacterium]|nr:SRPBCC family protein [Terriglobales bacterium]